MQNTGMDSCETFPDGTFHARARIVVLHRSRRCGGRRFACVRDSKGCAGRGRVKPESVTKRSREIFIPIRNPRGKKIKEKSSHDDNIDRLVVVDFRRGCQQNQPPSHSPLCARDVYNNNGTESFVYLPFSKIQFLIRMWFCFFLLSPIPYSKYLS